MSGKQGQSSRNNKKSNTKKPSRKSASKQGDTQKVGQEEPKPLTLDQAEKIIEKHGLELDSDEKGKRRYRKNKDLPVPEQGSQGSRNRLTKMITTRIEPEFIELFNQCAEQFPTKKEALQRAIELLAAELDPK